MPDNTSTRLPRIAFLCEGNAERYDEAFSGCAKFLVDALRELGHEVVTMDVRQKKASRLLTALRSWHWDRRRWQARFRRSSLSFTGRSAIAQRLMTQDAWPFDVILQIGAGFAPPLIKGVPVTMLCDWNAALSIKLKNNAYSAVHHLSAAEQDEFNQREKEVYSKVDRLFCFSDVLRQSFLDDYQLPTEKVFTVHAGPNLQLHDVPASRLPREPGHPPTILFIGKEYQRKGMDTLQAAFERVKQSLPSARLIIIGMTALPGGVLAGIDFRGFLRKDDPSERARLFAAYQEADVFCLPTRVDPFPTVVREAMHFGLPCITSNIWALPEMVVDGETGFTVPPDDVEALTARLLQVLQQPQLGERLGIAGRKRARELFTWERTAKLMSDEMVKLLPLHLTQQNA